MNLIEITNKAGKIKLSEVVQQPVMERLIDEIGKIFGANAAESGEYTGELTNCAENAVDTLEIEIHSPGGSVLDGYVLYSEIKKMQARGVYVTATINTLAASMASVIAMAADKIRMVPQGQMMIHDVQTGIRGNAQDLRKQADLIDGMSDEIAEIYAAKTGATTEAMRGKMKKETWMSAKVALAEKFIDEIYDPASEKNSIDIAAITTTSPRMTIFKSAKVTELEARVSDLEAENANLSESAKSVSDRNEELAGANGRIAELEAANAEIPTFEAELKARSIELHAANAEIVRLTAENAITGTKIGEAAAQLLAAQGHSAPVNLSGSNLNQGESKTITRAEFNMLDHSARNEFIASKGKITE